jgi:competence protein ComEA
MVSLRRIVTATTLVLGSMLMQAQATAPAKPATSAPQKSISQKIADDQNKLDINTATPDQLKAIPGIGDAYAKRIIDGRPYTAKNQLTTRGILPPAVYDKVKDQIIAHRIKK